MRPIATPTRLALAALIAFAANLDTFAQDESRPESNYVKLLKKAPESRLAPIVDIIGKRGDPADLAYLFRRAAEPGGFPAPVRLKALETLADAALTRKARPEGDLSPLESLLAAGVDPAARLAAVRLAGLWKAEATLAPLAALAGSKDVDEATRAEALASIANLGGDAARRSIEALASPDQPPATRARAVAALARLDLDAAAERAAGALTDDARIEDVAPLIAAFLDRQGGAEKLAAALGRKKPTADGARLGLRAVYALGRSDEALVAVLGKAAGIESEPAPLDKAEMDRLVSEVATRGDPARGEAIFRRAELNCMKCHAVSGAAGGVGPELSAIGLSSPSEYIIYSILIPDQSIKEEYQTRVVQTDDGRVLQGIVVEEDDRRLVLKDATAEERVIPAGSIEESRKGGSLMPKGLASLLTRAEFVDLVRYLSDLGKAGPYAVRTGATVQRWRALRPVPDEIAQAVPDPEAFRSAVLEADPGRWQPVYAWTAGQLPVAEAVAAGGGPVAYLQGEVVASAAGPVVLKLGDAKGISAWLDDQPIPPGDAPTVDLPEGRHRLTLRVDSAERGPRPIRAEFARAEGSAAEFSVVGGR